MTTRQYQQANPHRAGHNSGLHPEDQPFLTDNLEDDPSYYTTRPPTSTRRYNVPAIRQDNAPVTYYGPPPVPRRSSQYTVAKPVVKPKAGRFGRAHWLAYLGLGIMIMLIGWLVGQLPSAAAM